eukprot:TRINITY_DN33921_c0_g1_i1.p1 TRINITY_DN33921_c0_g1~~TRINITY_DN33921_c0_g1_i1.p1  ORF type:complete len:430 (-),score=66.44 TRINITY_DN33921_c0_g1_i1:106-1395(-)
MADETTPLVEDQKTLPRDQLLLVAASGYYMFIWSAFTSLMNPLLPHYMEDYGGDVYQQSLVLAALQIGWLIAFPLVQMSRMSSASLMNVAAACLICAPDTVAVMPGILQLILANALKGCGSAICSVLLTGMMAREIPAEYFGKAVGIRNASGCGGACLAAALGGLCYNLSGLQLPMALLALAAMPLLAVFRALPGRYFESQDDRRFKEKTCIGSDLQLWLHPEVLGLLTISFTTWTLISFTYLAVPKVMHESFRLPVLTTMMVWLIWDVLKTASSYLGGMLADAFPARRSLLAGLAMQLLCYAVAALSLDSVQSRGDQYLYLTLWAIIIALGSTGNGLLGPSFLKDLMAVEKNTGGDRYEELVLMKDFVATLALFLGPMLTASSVSTVGFRVNLLALTGAGLVALLHLGIRGDRHTSSFGAKPHGDQAC